MPIVNTLSFVSSVSSEAPGRPSVADHPFQLENLAATIHEGRPGDNLDLAIDALVGLTARTDDEGFNARNCLRAVYRDSATSPHTRVKLLNACSGLCNFLIDSPKHGELSATVMRLGWHAPEPPEGSSGNALRTRIDQVLANRLNGKAITEVLSEVGSPESNDCTSDEGASRLADQALHLEIACGGWEVVDGRVTEANDRRGVAVAQAPEDPMEARANHPADVVAPQPPPDPLQVIPQAPPVPFSESEIGALRLREEVGADNALRVRSIFNDVVEVNVAALKRDSTLQPHESLARALQRTQDVFAPLEKHSRLFDRLVPEGDALKPANAALVAFGGTALVAQLPLRFSLMLTQCHEAANAKPPNMKKFMGAIREVGPFYASRLKATDHAIEKLRKIPKSSSEYRNAQAVIGALIEFRQNVLGKGLIVECVALAKGIESAPEHALAWFKKPE